MIPLACFGSAIAVSANSASCRACASSAACLDAASVFLAKLPDSELVTRERLALAVTRQALVGSPPVIAGVSPQPAVVASSRGVKRITLAPSDQALVSVMPARVASHYKSLMERGWFTYARNELNAGRTPAAKGWLGVVCGLVARGPFTRAQLLQAFQTDLGLSLASAKVQVSVAITILAAARLVREFQGQVLLVQPASNSQH